MKLNTNNIKKVTGKFKPKAIVVMVDEMSEVMSGSNYRLVSEIQENIGSIARLGRAGGVHLVLATQRPSSNVINSDLKNNIQQSVLLGDFDSGASSLIFDEDVSHLSKPEIKGRGFVKNGKDIIEFQSYWTDPEKDFKYNDKTTYINSEEDSTIKEHPLVDETPNYMEFIKYEESDESSNDESNKIEETNNKLKLNLNETENKVLKFNIKQN